MWGKVHGHRHGHGAWARHTKTLNNQRTLRKLAWISSLLGSLRKRITPLRNTPLALDCDVRGGPRSRRCRAPTVVDGFVGIEMCVLVCAFYVHRTGHSRTHHCGVSLKTLHSSLAKMCRPSSPVRGRGGAAGSLLSQRGHVRGPTEPAFAVRAHADKEAAHAIDKTLAPRVL